MDPQSSSSGTNKLPVLIVDKKGILGAELAKRICEDLLVVLVTASPVDRHENIIHIPYHRRIPKIPDNAYSRIFVVYSGESEVMDMLSSFSQKVKESKGEVILLTSLLYSSLRVFSHLQQPALHSVRVVIVGEVFGRQQLDPSETSFFIQQAREQGRIEIPNTGMGHLFPVLFEDAIGVILSVAFGKEKKARVILAFPKHPFTQLSVARLLQKIDPVLKVDFRNSRNKTKSYYIPPEGEYAFSNYDLERTLRTQDMTPLANKRTKSHSKQNFRAPDPDAKKRRILLVSTLLFSLFIAPIILTAFLAVAGAGFLRLSIAQAEDGKIDRAAQSAMFAQSSLSASSELVPGLVLLQVIVPQQHKMLADNIDIGRDIVEAEQEILSSLQIMQNIYDKKSLDPKNDFYRALATLKNTLLTLQKMEAEERLPGEVVRKLDQYNGVLRMVEGTIDTLPALLGFEGKKTYLLLFQNNMELRPGGGFIGSYGIISVQNGQMEKLQIHDVYDADGQLKKKIEPPFGLKRYLGASNWFLRDSNYEIDYSRNAVQAAQFLKLETGQNVDGVIAIDTTFLKDLISVLGQVAVLDYSETVTPDNFYLMTQNHAEKGFFPGSTQKKDFLRSLANSLMVELLEKKNVSYDKLLLQLEQSIRHKHVLFAFADEGIQNVFSVNGLSSSLKDGRAQGDNTFLDFFGVIDANVGTNKANYYVKRSIIHQVAFDGAGGIQGAAEASYVNSSERNSPYGGDYKNYVRFVLPQEAVLQNIAFDNTNQTIIPAVVDAALYSDPSFIPPSGLEVEQTETLGKQVIGFFFIVPAGQTKNVRLTYIIPEGVNLRESAFSYNLRLFKQPGTLEDPYTLFLSYPNGFTPVKNESKAAELGGKLIYESKLDQDKDIVVSFSKK